MSKNLGIQEAFRWRETRGQRLTVPPLYWSPLPGLLSCLLSVITVISSPLLSWQGLTVLPQPDITRKEMFSSLEDCAAKCYLLLQSTVQGSCGHSLVWRTFFFAFDPAQGGYQGQKQSPCFSSTYQLLTRWFKTIPLENVSFGGWSNFPYPSTVGDDSLAKSLLCFSEGYCPFFSCC